MTDRLDELSGKPPALAEAGAGFGMGEAEDGVLVLGKQVMVRVGLPKKLDIGRPQRGVHGQHADVLVIL